MKSEERKEKNEEHKTKNVLLSRHAFSFWRRGWDSNPRGVAPKLISMVSIARFAHFTRQTASATRYDHFDTFIVS